MTVFKIIKDGFRQSEFRNAITQNTADLVSDLKDRYFIAIAGKNDRDGQTSRTGADDRDLHAIGRFWTFDHLVGIES